MYLSKKSKNSPRAFRCGTCTGPVINIGNLSGGHLVGSRSELSGNKVKLFLTINLLFNVKCLDVGSPVEIAFVTSFCNDPRDAKSKLC